jgi:hypothetical protein
VNQTVDVGDIEYGHLPPERLDHFHRLEAAQLVATDALMTTRDNIEAVIEPFRLSCRCFVGR